MLENDPPGRSLVGWTHIVGMRLDCLERLNVEPILGLGIALPAMNVNGLISFIGVEVETPPENYQNRRHTLLHSLRKQP